MRVFVAIKVGEVDSSSLNSPELCSGFGLDFLGIQFSSQRATREVGQTRT
jgi:hypothetical protein